MLNIDQSRIEKVVADQIIDDLINNDKITDDIRTGIDKRIDAIFADKAQTIIAERVDAAIRDGFDRTYQRVDQWGKPTGSPTTIKAELDRLVGSYWSDRVNAKTGEKTDSAYSSVSRAEYLMSVICAKDFSETMRTSALSVAGHLKDGFRNQIAKHMDNLLDELFRIKSLQDQGKVEKPY